MILLLSVGQMLSKNFLRHGPRLAGILVVLALLALPGRAQNQSVRVIAFGAHPDDCDQGLGDSPPSMRHSVAR
jgi:hypothetical protein